jgi:uncharacterized membrane protein (UPF0127 family)
MAHFLAALLDGVPGPHGLRNATREVLLASSLDTAFDSGSRRRGLLGRGGLADGTGLVIAPCNAIHTWFMRFPIDVLFVGRDGRVLKRVDRLRPWRLAASLRAFAVVELPAGSVQQSATAVGDRLIVEPHR